MASRVLPRVHPFRLRALAVMIAVLSALAVAAAGAASAETWHRDDASGDVYVFGEEGEPSGIDPSRAAGDVLRTDVNYTRSHLVVRLTFREALPSDRWYIGVGILTRAKGAQRSFDLRMYREEGGHPRGLKLINSYDQRVRCSGLTRTIEGRVVRLILPSACIGKPSLVRLAVGLNPQDDAADDALRDGFADGDSLALSRRIYRG